MRQRCGVVSTSKASPLAPDERLPLAAPPPASPSKAAASAASVDGCTAASSDTRGSDTRGSAHGIGRGRESKGRASAVPGREGKNARRNADPPPCGGRAAGRRNDLMRTMPSELGAVATPTPAVARSCPQSPMAATHPVTASCCQRKILADGYFLARAQQNAEKKD